MFSTLSLFVNAQQAIDTVKLSNDKQIVVYDNYTWKYLSESDTIKSIKNNDNTYTSKVPLHSTTKTTLTTKDKPTYQSSSTSSSICGARTKSGGYCKRVVKGGGRCWQHR